MSSINLQTDTRTDVLQSPQTEAVWIFRKFIENTFDEWMNGRQVDKAICDLATRAMDPYVTRLLVQALDDAQIDLVASQKSPDADRLRQLLAGVDPDAIVLAGSNVPIDLEDETTTQLRPRTSRRNVIDTLDDENDLDYVHDNGPGDEAADDDPGDEAADDDDVSVDFRVTALNELQDVFQKMTLEQRDTFSFDDVVKWKLLNLDSTKVYTTYDLKDVKVLERGLRLLYARRLGRSNEITWANIHIKYDALSPALRKTIEDKFRVRVEDKKDIKRLFSIGVGEGVTQDEASRKRLRCEDDEGDRDMIVNDLDLANIVYDDQASTDDLRGLANDHEYVTLLAKARQRLAEMGDDEVGNSGGE